MTPLGDPTQRLLADGNALEDRGDFAGALRLYQEARDLAPDHPRPLLNIGNALQRQGNRTEAIAAFQTAIEVAPEFAPAHFNLGNLWAAMEDFDRAVQALRAALRIDPVFTDAAVALANALDAAHRAPEAEIVLRDAVTTSPAAPGPLHNLALMLIDRAEYDEAEALILRALAADPAFAPSYGAMASLCVQTGRVRDAETWYRKALAVGGDLFEAGAGLLFSLNARDDLSAEQVFDAHLEFGRALVAHTAAPTVALDARIRPHDRLRIGYLSGDFRQHAVALFMLPVLQHHDRSSFEVYCYYSHRAGDQVTERVRRLADHWRDIAGMDDEAAVARIRADAIDVLIDLSGYTAHSRVSLAARRCAPVQMTWLGYLNTTGLPNIDYRICDAQTDPPGETEHLHSERLLRLPNSQWCYEPIHAAAGEVRFPSNPQHVVFGSLNQFWKISDTCLELWLEILRSTPRSELRVLGVPRGRTADAFRRKVERGGVSADRLSLSPRLDIQRYFGAIAKIDIALDTTPYNGATTTLDALWCGLPLVALVGTRSIARGSASILTTLGLTDLLARTRDRYLEINLRLANDHHWRAHLRSTLRQHMADSPLMDGPRFTRGLEALYRSTLEVVPPR